PASDADTWNDVGAIAVEPVGRTVGFAELAARAIREDERRAVAGRGHACLGLRHCRRAAAEVIHAYRVAFALGDTLESHDHAPLLAGLYREDARAQQAVAHPFDQRRIGLPSPDLVLV